MRDSEFVLHPCGIFAFRGGKRESASRTTRSSQDRQEAWKQITWQDLERALGFPIVINIYYAIIYHIIMYIIIIITISAISTISTITTTIIMININLITLLLLLF